MCKNAFLIPGLPNRLYVPKIVILFDCVISSHEWSLITLSTRELWIKYCSCCECSYVTGFCSVFNHKNLYVFEKHCTTTVSHVFFNKWKKHQKKNLHIWPLYYFGGHYIDMVWNQLSFLFWWELWSGVEIRWQGNVGWHMWI